jgi:hypothetical protein
MTSPINIAVINESTAVTDDEVKNVMAACQIQLDRDYYPIWAATSTMTFVDKTQPIPAGFWSIVILDNSDAAGALGYHDLTQEGMPLAKVFAGDDKKYGLEWSVTFSHELLEMMADPDINLTVFVPTQTGGEIFAYENCDAVEDDSLAYDINGVKVSDFVTPAWFNIYAVPGTKFDFCGHVTQPFQILSGGYIGVLDISNLAQGWTQIQAKSVIPARTLMAKQINHTEMRPRLIQRSKTALVRSVK